MAFLGDVMIAELKPDGIEKEATRSPGIEMIVWGPPRSAGASTVIAD